MQTVSKNNLKRGLIAVTIVLMLLVANSQPVQGMFFDMNILVSLWRFEKEVLQASPAGQYYEGLAWNHIFEAIRIVRENPEHLDNIHSLAYLTLPHLDALLDGEGDTAVITEEQVKAVQTEVNWWMSVASPSFQADIQKTVELYPLETFIGMTMNEAVEYVNARFVETVEKPNLVNGTDGKWASYVFKEVYFEYPSSWYVQVEGDRYEHSHLRIIPFTESGEQWDTGVTSFEAWKVLPDSRGPVYLHREIDYVNAIWEEPVTVDGMEGYYFSYDWSHIGLFRKVISILYNQEKKIKVRVTVNLFNPEGMFFDFDPRAAREKYEYLFHITESVRFR